MCKAEADTECDRWCYLRRGLPSSCPEPACCSSASLKKTQWEATPPEPSTCQGKISTQGLRAGSRTGSAVNGEATPRPRPSSLPLEEQELRASLTTAAKTLLFKSVKSRFPLSGRSSPPTSRTALTRSQGRLETWSPHGPCSPLPLLKLWLKALAPMPKPSGGHWT